MDITSSAVLICATDPSQVSIAAITAGMRLSTRKSAARRLLLLTRPASWPWCCEKRRSEAGPGKPGVLQDGRRAIDGGLQLVH